MTEWDHGHPDGPDGPEPGHEPAWEALGPEPDAHLAEPPGLDDPYGSPDEPGPEHAAADEPAGLPEEQPADWSGPADDVLHSEPGAWEPEGGHDPFGTAEPDDLSDGTDPAGWTADTNGDPFPPALDVDVQPGDGGPWVDPDLLGGPDHWSADTSGPELVTPVDPPAALLPDLAAADGDPDADWDTLRDSDDPATRALTRHWNP
jgi:hypothetical protein